MFLSHMQYTDAEGLGLSVEDVFGILLVCQIIPLARYSILFMNLKPFQLNTLNSFPCHALLYHAVPYRALPGDHVIPSCYNNIIRLGQTLNTCQ
jgi:hypothetical protein